MLKHVHSSPHRSSSASIRRNFVDQGYPPTVKHVRQTSSPTSFCVSCSSKDLSKFPQNRPESPSILEDSQRSSESSLVNPGSPTKHLANASSEVEKLNSSSCSETDSFRSRTFSEPPVICPKCFKKKRKPLITSESPNKLVSQNICSDTVKEEEDDKCTTVQEHSAVIDGSTSSFICSRIINLDIKTSSFSNEPRCSTPVDVLHKIRRCHRHHREDDEHTSFPSLSPASSPSQSSECSVASSKSPYLRTKDRAAKNDENKLFRGRLDNLSLDSSMSCSTSSREDTFCSLSSSAISLPDNLKQTMVRVWVRCLMQEMEYKTICVSYGTTCRQVVQHLLSKFKMKHRDPNLFYLAMEVTIKKAGAEVRTCLRLDDTSFPAQLVECHPKEYSRLALRMRRGGLIRIYDKDVSQGSHYKSLLVGEKISCSEVMRLVLACNKVAENPNTFVLVEVWPKEGREKVLSPDEEPMIIASEWEDKEAVRFEMRRISNPTNHIASSNDVISSNSAHIDAERNDNEKGISNNEGSFVGESLNINNKNLKSKQISSNNFEEDKNCDSNFDGSDSLSFSSDTPSSSSISSSPLQPQSTADTSIADKYISKLKEKLESKDHPCPTQETKQRRKLPQTPSFSLMKNEVEVENQNEKSPVKNFKAINFKTYHDYENYFYI